MNKETEIGGNNYYFKETLWTIILRAKDQTEPRYREALDSLITTYWKPVYYYIRRKGYDVEAAKDLTQGFFAVFMEKNFLQTVGKEKGRFRTFILSALNHFLSNEREYMQAYKRGGSKVILPLEFTQMNKEVSLEPHTEETPEKALTREWYLTILQRALENLRQESTDQPPPGYWNILNAYLISKAEDSSLTYQKIAQQFGISEEKATNYIYRARKRCRELIENEITQYVADEAEFKEEMEELFSIFNQTI